MWGCIAAAVCFRLLPTYGPTHPQTKLGTLPKKVSVEATVQALGDVGVSAASL